MHRTLTTLAAALLAALLSGSALAHGDPDVLGGDLSQFGAGTGPWFEKGTLHLLDAEGSFGQSNAIALGGSDPVAVSGRTVKLRMRVGEGGDGGAFLFLNTDEYGTQGPAPYVRSWVEPNLRGTFAVAIDVHDPLNEEPFGDWGNYQGLPEREVSLHWDGREIVKRVAPEEFRGDWTDVEIAYHHVCGGAEVTVRIAGAAVYDGYFVAEMLPYPARLAVGAGTRADVATTFDIEKIVQVEGEPAAELRRPLHVQLFNHVLTDNSKTSFETEAELPPLDWAFGRVILTLEIHDAGPDWDEWDRNGHLYLVDEQGEKWDIAPFITSYRTECRWKVDVTHFRPWLTGKRRFEIHAGTTFYKNRGYMMSASLDFHHGVPRLGDEALEPYRVVPLWHTTARYQSEENHFSDAFEEKAVPIWPEVRAARIVTFTTGHSQVGEFTPSDRAIEVQGDPHAGEPAVFESTLWKTDCYLNPNRPQYGTWKYSRAGWAPGDVVRPWWIDVTSAVVPGQTAHLRYVPQPYDLSEAPEDERPEQKQVNEASHVVRSYLILYRTPGESVPAPTVRVTSVAGGSAAAKAGIREGDYLTSYDGTRIDSIEELTEAKKVATDAGKEVVPVVVYRGSERLELEIATGQLGVNLSTR